MADAGTVVVNLDANSIKLQREMDKAERATRKATQRMRKQVVTEFSRMGKQAALFGVAVASAMAVAARASIQFADSIAKTADRVGVSTDALQELRFAASQAGVAQSALEMGLQRFSRRIGEAVKGQGELRDTLKQYNIELRNADGSTRSVEAILRDYADAVASANSEQEQLLMSVKGFDSEGAPLVNLFRGGSKAINDYAAQARELNLVLEERLIRSAEDVANKMDILNKAFKVQVAAVVLENAEAIHSLVQSLISLVPSLVNATAKMLDFFGILKQLPASVYEENIAILGQRLRQADADIAASNGRNKRAAEIRKQRLIKELREQEDLLKASRERSDAFMSGLDFLASSNTDTAPDTPSGGSSTTAAIIEEISENARRAEQIIASTRNEYEKFADAAVEAYALLNEGLINQEVFDRWLEAHQVRMEEVEVAAEETFDQMSVFADQAARNMQDQFADFLFDPFNDGLGGMLRGFIDTMRRMAAEAAASQIFKMLGASLAGSSTDWIAAIGASFGGGKAAGGPVSPSKGYIVGERGPEWFQPSTSGTIVPNHAMGGGVTFNIDARGADAQLTRALPAILESFGQRIKGDIAMSRSRGRAM